MRPVEYTVALLAAALAVFSYFCADALAETKRALSGEYEYGEKYTEVYVEPDASSDARDDEEYERYVYRNSWLQFDQPLAKNSTVSIRAQQLDRDYATRPQLDNTTRYAKIRFSLEPRDNWAVWPHVSVRRKDYDLRALDNEIIVAGVESRYRWGIRDNVRVGMSWTRSRYDDDAARDRDAGSLFASLEKPVNDALTLRVGARAEMNDFETQSASRENATKGSASVGFRYEF